MKSKAYINTHEYNEKNRTRLEKGLEIYEYSLKEKERDDKWKVGFYKNIEKQRGKDIAIKMKKQTEKKDLKKPINLAKSMIQLWKLNKVIFNKYGGGKVVHHQFFGSIEPIDAYRLLIEDIKNKGKLTILKPSLQNILLAPEDYYNKGLRITKILKLMCVIKPA